METHAAAGDFVDPTASPQLAGLGDYDAEQYVHEGNIFEVGAAMLTFAWNTDLVPDGLTDYPDLLDPSLAGGKIGVPDPAIGPALVDFYLWLEEKFGEDYVPTLAAQEPRIYPSSLPIGEALQSGEIYAGAFAAPVQLVPAPGGRGARRLRDLRGRRRLGRPLLRRASRRPSDSPNAAALLADFMVTAEGQELVQGASGSVLPDIPGTLITNDRVREHGPRGHGARAGGGLRRGVERHVPLSDSARALERGPRSRRGPRRASGAGSAGVRSRRVS